MTNVGERGQCYAFLGRLEAKASDTVIIGIVTIYHRPTFVLFYLGSTYSYVSAYLSSGFDLSCDSMSMPIPVHVLTPLGKPLVVEQVYRSCFVTLVGYETWMDIIILDMEDLILFLLWIGRPRIMLLFIVMPRPCLSHAR